MDVWLNSNYFLFLELDQFKNCKIEYMYYTLKLLSCILQNVKSLSLNQIENEKEAIFSRFPYYLLCFLLQQGKFGRLRHQLSGRVTAVGHWLHTCVLHTTL